MKDIHINSVNIEQIGKINLGSYNDKLVFLSIKIKPENYFEDKKYNLIKNKNSCQNAIKQLEEYFSKKRKSFDLKVDFLNGTEFQKEVWTTLKSIPFGETISYKELAKKIGNEKASRAIGNANGKNPIPIIIPCHRVINSDGKLGGYSMGLNAKKLLLTHERGIS